MRQTSARLPWLLIGMLGGIGNSMILGNFDTTFAAHPEMALYIPLIGGIDDRHYCFLGYLLEGVFGIQ